MTIAAGAKLGSYEVTAQIGAGGMGEVYQAHDTKLGRDVAIKVLPEAFANDPERLSRFQREAKMLAALNHPNIATIHGLEASGSTHYLVMELVAGETLADRVKGGSAVPVDEALGIAKQIAEALEAAHEKGIIHRDLKPANVKVTPEGKVKVLDFGLAKAFEGDATTEDMSNSPTLSMAATMQGVILGTAAYMSPEQARGKAVDKRTDIWAFGCVLYELLTGKQAFHGDDVTDILAAVVRAEPDWSKLPETTPFSVRVLLRRCLQKDKALRLHDAADARIDIVETLAAPRDVGATAAASASKSKLPWAVAAALAIIAIVTSAALWRATRTVDPVLQPLVRLDVDLGSDVSLNAPVGATIALSPDGNRMVYVSQGKLFTRKLDQPKATELAGTDGVAAPFFSPDGQWIAFYAQGNLKKISVEGGAAINLFNAPAFGGGSWGEDGNIIAALAGTGGLSRIPSAGGAPTSVTELAQGELSQRWPQILPGGKGVLFTSANSTANFDQANIEVVTLTDGHRKTLVRGGTYGRYLPSGHLVYVNSGTLFAVPFDLEKLEVHGAAVPVQEQVGYSTIDGSAQFAFARESTGGAGTLMYLNGGASSRGLVTIKWLDSTGKTEPLLANPDAYFWPHLSPDGQRLAFSITDVWVYEIRRDITTRLTFDSGTWPVWSPDGRYIVFRKLGEGMFAVRSDGAGKPQQLTQSKNPQLPYSFTPDGKRLSFQESDPKTGFDIWTLPLESDSAGLRAGKPEPFLRTEHSELRAAFSTDGRWLTYQSNESGTNQIYVRAFPDKGGKWQVSSTGGQFPMWSHTGHELFFGNLDNQIMVATYTVSGDSFLSEKPRLWSETHVAPMGGGRIFDVGPDGKRIVALMPVDTPEAQNTQNHLIFLENFFDELRRKVPLSGK